MTTQRFTAALLATTLLAGAASAATLDIALDSSPAGLDPHLVTAFNSVMMVQGNIYQALTDTDASLAVVPGLAESWTVSDDGLTYTFKLRSGVTFHDGSAFDATDAAASIRRVLSKDIASPLASRVSPVAEATATDAQTLVLKLSAPFAPLLSSLAGIAMVPAEVETNKDGLQKTPVGTGPYKFVEWQPNGFLSMVAHEGYTGAVKPQVKDVKFHFVPEAATRQAGLIRAIMTCCPALTRRRRCN
jgi:peptide/nickel transport system substrate-binding protein